ncbi:hypothetical protein ACMA5I_12170 [Paracoccaceae bacterium GXU_MW_L88]
MSNEHIQSIADSLHHSGGGSLDHILRARAIERIAERARQSAEAAGKNPELAAHRAVSPGTLGLIVNEATVVAKSDDRGRGNLVASFSDAEKAKPEAPEAVEVKADTPVEAETEEIEVADTPAPSAETPER